MPLMLQILLSLSKLAYDVILFSCMFLRHTSLLQSVRRRNCPFSPPYCLSASHCSCCWPSSTYTSVSLASILPCLHSSLAWLSFPACSLPLMLVEKVRLSSQCPLVKSLLIPVLFPSIPIDDQYKKKSWHVASLLRSGLWLLGIYPLFLLC